MAMDTAQKRMSAMHVSSPWRGAMVDAPEAGFSVGNRQAAAYMYSGIESGAVVVVISDSVPTRLQGLHRCHTLSRKLIWVLFLGGLK
jgi:hypothetical protein